MEKNMKDFRYLAKIPNNEEEKQLIKLLRKYYNRDRYKIRVKGSKINKSKCPNVEERRMRNDFGAIPLGIADYWRIYIDRRDYENIY